MTARVSQKLLPLPASRRHQPGYREQRRQKVEEYLSRRKTFSGLFTQQKEMHNSSNRTGKVACDELQGKVKSLNSAKQKMENKENAESSPANQSSRTLEKSMASLNYINVKATTILTESSARANCSSEDLSPAVNASKNEAVETQTQLMSFSQSFLHKRSIKEKKLIAEKQISDASLPKKPVLGSYRGKIIPSKINSFWKTQDDIDGRSSSANKKPVVVSQLKVRPSLPSSSSAVMKTIKATNSASAVKLKGTTPFQNRPPAKASISHSQSTQNKEKQTSSSVLGSTVTVQRKPSKSVALPLKTAFPSAKTLFVAGAKKTEASSKDVRSGASAKSVSLTCGASSTQDKKAVGNKLILPKESAEDRRIRLAEWRASKGKAFKKLLPTAVPVTKPEGSTLHTTSQKPVESFWTTIEEEDEEGIISEKVTKTLAECLHSTEQGCPRDKIHATLDNLIQCVPKAKKIAKYWVCQMRLEQTGPIEKIIAVYEEAILAGAEPKQELRSTVADIMKNSECLSKSQPEMCVKEEVDLNNDRDEINNEANSSIGKVEETFQMLNLNDEEKPEVTNEVKKEEKIVLVSEMNEEYSSKEDEHRNKEKRKKTVKYKDDQDDNDAVRVLPSESRTPDKENEASYVIKYSVSTTPHLEREKRKMQCAATGSAVKDLRFLTPVRRSRRLQEMSKLNMFKDHDPMVSSLEQLKELGSQSNAFIFRKNSAL
ncbi:PREDICTED: cytoskeleton-associated protein 2 isoform X1 [Gavialis gangeticus]|uniref:cytoskeleton-associated protein 2 isoform X1 n=1 Tax=Gavialis gangeticus TaxID=94835 RepID=UPI00092F5458|nr:PREDICTED: cytoskeleton-associated protein 2 isoform X1 [Gavialis gangeticus]